MAVTCGRDFYKESRDSFDLGAPGEGDGGIFYVGYTNTTWWADV